MRFYVLAVSVVLVTSLPAADCTNDDDAAFDLPLSPLVGGETTVTDNGTDTVRSPAGRIVGPTPLTSGAPQTPEAAVGGRTINPTQRQVQESVFQPLPGYHPYW